MATLVIFGFADKSIDQVYTKNVFTAIETFTVGHERIHCCVICLYIFPGDLMGNFSGGECREKKNKLLAFHGISCGGKKSIP